MLVRQAKRQFGSIKVIDTCLCRDDVFLLLDPISTSPCFEVYILVRTVTQSSSNNIMGSIGEPTASINGILAPAQKSHDDNIPVPRTKENTTNGHDPHESVKIPMHDVPAFTPSKKLRVVTIGAGFSGMLFAHKLQYTHAKEFDNLVEHTIYESRSAAGGTWIANT